MDALISVATGLVGTLVGAAIAWLAGKRLHRLKTTYDMHRELHSPEMTHSRNLGGVTVQKHSSKTYDEMRRMLSPEDTQHIWNVMYFYERLSLAIKNENIHKKYVGEMFGENFIWWYLKSYDKQLVNIDIDEDIRWQASRNIASLQAWLYENTDRNQYEQWVRRANKMQDPIAQGWRAPRKPTFAGHSRRHSRSLSPRLVSGVAHPAAQRRSSRDD